MKRSNIDDGFKKNQPAAIETESSKTILQILEKRGIRYVDLLDTAMEFYVPHPGIETTDKAKAVFEREFYFAIGDPNLQMLIYAGVLLEQEGEAGELPGVSRESFEKDLSFIIADEILGDAVADYIAGSKGRFEFVRFDKNKPGILKTLGPFMDDVIGGLLGGVSANMYSRAMFEFENEKKSAEKKSVGKKSAEKKPVGKKSAEKKLSLTQSAPASSQKPGAKK
ncbi:alpha-ribazole phosphatase CobZ [Methanolapillus ohkumae]|uniref:Alpha-ribazole phosphatase CobZ n=1 Tax=Methanolapillus ohkumae TaxID=3028298 RepID=A0AA96V858_9EURY|nr:hypothetical protein MsAm2_11850 [Methanosarcinaceae archaeon Am2]